MIYRCSKFNFKFCSREAIGVYIASYKVSKNQEKVLEVYKRIVDDPLDREDPQMRKDLKAVLDIIQSSSN